MFERFKIVKYNVAGRSEWGISRRFWLLWYKRLIHKKYVFCDDSNSLKTGMASREILTFTTEEQARDEVDRLRFGYKPIISRSWRKGECIGEQYE